MARVRVEADPVCDRIFPYQFPAILQVRTTDGRVLRQEVLANRGGPERPLSDAEILRKFTDNTAGVLTDGQLQRFRHAVDHLEELDDVSALLEPLQPSDHP